MVRTITIEPVTRIEGHARVTIALGDDGRVADARVHVLELRGFEALCAGRLVTELPALTSRICGICPVSHALAAAQAGDLLLGAAPPPAALRLRALVQLGQLVQSHALSLFLLSGPDLVPGAAEVEPSRRSFLGLAARAPDLVRDGLALRRFGQTVIERVAGRRVHPAFSIPGGVVRPLDRAARDDLRAAVPDALGRARRALDALWEPLADGAASARLGAHDGVFLALVGEDGALGLTGGRLRAVGARGEVRADGVGPARFADLLGERAVPGTRAAHADWRGPGGDAAIVVGPLARLNVVARCGTPRADAALARFRALATGPVRDLGLAHLARLVEVVHAIERAGELLDGEDLLDPDVRAPPGARCAEAVGACEAPRGTLFHRVRADPDGIATFVDLVVPTGVNARAMDAAVRSIAEDALSGARVGDALVARIEAGLRAFDPCLSCATHAAGERWVAVRLVGPDGATLDASPGWLT